MKGEKLIEALGKIDDRLVLSVMPIARERKRRSWPVMAAAAAVAALFLFVFPKELRPAIPENHSTPAVETEQNIPASEVKLQPFMVPTLPDAFPATISQAKQMGIVLRSLELRNIIPDTLPVFQRAGESPVPDYAAMKALARELAARLQMNAEPKKYGRTVSLTDGHTITVDSTMTAEILFETPLTLPSAYDLTTNEGAWLAATWIRANYLRDLDVEELHTEVAGSDKKGWEVRVCDAAKDSRWYAIDTGMLRFVLGSGGVERIIQKQSCGRIWLLCVGGCASGAGVPHHGHFLSGI